MSDDLHSSNVWLCGRCQDIFRGCWVEEDYHERHTPLTLINGERQFCLGCPDWMHTPPRSADHRLSPSPFLHYSVPELMASAKLGCYLCSVTSDRVRDAQMEIYHEYRAMAQSAIGVLVVRPSYVDEETDRVVLEVEISYLRGGKCDSVDVYIPVKVIFSLESVHDDDKPVYTPSSGIVVPPALVELIKEWAMQCQSQHLLCSQRSIVLPDNPTNTLPTRLLDTMSIHDARYIRLVYSKELPQGSATYVTLSHCWGKNLPVRLLTTNHDEFLDGIDLGRLPRTFQEAVSFTRALGVRYLWIDTLCIIQDSHTDWLHESQRMIQVFSHALLNIAATASPNGDGGLFRQRDLPLISSNIVTASWTGHPVGRYRFVDPTVWERRVENGPLNQRAWVFQERMLAVRTVHFARDQIWWECAMTRACESYPDQLPDMVYHIANGSPVLMMLNLEKGKDIEGNDIWVNYLQNYTKKQITRDSDRLVALAGVATEFGHLMDWSASNYHAGLWRYDMGIDLLWKMSESGSRDLQCYVAPSWSWASVKGEVSFDNTANRNLIREAMAVQIMDVRTEYVGSRFGHVLQGSISIRGSLYKIRFSHAHPDFPKIMQKLSISNMHGCEVLSLSDEDFEEIFDDETLYDQAPIAEISAYWCRFATYLPPNGQSQFRSLGLMLQQVRGAASDDSFQRIGWLKIDHSEHSIDWSASANANGILDRSSNTVNTFRIV